MFARPSAWRAGARRPTGSSPIAPTAPYTPGLDRDPNVLERGLVLPVIRRLGAGFVELLLAFGPIGTGRALAAAPMDDTYPALEDEVLSIAAPGVLANDEP